MPFQVEILVKIKFFFGQKLKIILEKHPLRFIKRRTWYSCASQSAR